MTKPRKDILKWDEYFMGIALLSALRSKDPSTQVGACIVSLDNKILSLNFYLLSGRNNSWFFLRVKKSKVHFLL